ncbi:MAG: hypothetical protein M4579_004827 [Chaenotheca gracillima]|nr:MAG: hypothetical protein M4579_004827 [Chaenotheca gracillima]
MSTGRRNRNGTQAPNQIPKWPQLPTSAPDLDILGDQVTIHPGPPPRPETLIAPSEPTIGSDSDSATASEQHDRITTKNTDRNLVAHMARFRESPLDFLREVSLHVSGTGWRAYDDVIGAQPIFYPGFSDTMREAVMSGTMLQGKIEELAERRVGVEEVLQGWRVVAGVGPGEIAGGGQAGGEREKKGREWLEKRRTRRKKELVNSLHDVAERMVDQMICKFESKRFIRGAYYLCTQLLTRAYHQGIHVSSEEVLRLRAFAEQTAAKKQSIIFLPCHRSHVDYVSLQLICYRLGLALPTVVAGDNLNFPVVGQFLQNAGAMYIRRSFGDDVLYTTVVQTYIDTLLQKGFNFECFIEGGRSRTGKLLPPKFGILSFILDTILSGRVEDAIICPVSTQYDKVIETEGYVNELLGVPKQKENLVDFLSASSILSLRLGRVDVRFHEPWSLKEFITQQQERADISGQIDMNKVNQSEVRTRLLRTLGYKVLSDINDVSVVMPTALIGTVLLTLRGRGVGKSELVRRVDWLSERVRGKGGRVAHFGGLPTAVVADRALEVLGPGLVKLVEGLGEDTYYAVDRFQLSFYRNMTIHLFISEALVAAGMYSRVRQGGGPENQRISYDALLEQVAFLSQLFRGEFIFPTQGLSVNLDRTLQGLEEDQVIKIDRELSQSGTPGKITTIELTDTERLCGRENYDFYCFLIWPFIEAIWLGAVSLLGMTPPLNASDDDMWLDNKQAQDCAQLLGKTLFHQGDLSYFEAVNKETLKNAFERFEEEGIILVAKGAKAAKGAPKMKLAPDWMPKRDDRTGKIKPQGRLWDFTATIAQSRREGDNPCEEATVSAKVLTLADHVCKVLFETAVPASELGAPQRQREEAAKSRQHKAMQTKSSRL